MRDETDGRPNPEPAEAPALLRAALDLSGRLLTVEAAAHRVRQRNDDEAIHDTRVASRRLVAAIDLWTPVLDAAAARRARRRLRRLRRRLAEVRDLEVMCALLRDRLLQVPPAARVILESRLAKLERRRERARADAVAIASPDRLARIRRALLRAVRRSAAPPREASPPALARDAIRATRQRALAAVADAQATRSDTALHEARVRIKAWRYTREVAAEGGVHEPAPGAPRLSDLRALQRALGHVQDLAVTLAEIERGARRAHKRGQPARADALQGVVDALREEKSRAVAEAQRRSTILSVAAVRGRVAEA